REPWNLSHNPNAGGRSAFLRGAGAAAIFGSSAVFGSSSGVIRGGHGSTAANWTCLKHDREKRMPVSRLREALAGTLWIRVVFGGRRPRNSESTHNHFALAPVRRFKPALMAAAAAKQSAASATRTAQGKSKPATRRSSRR